MKKKPAKRKTKWLGWHFADETETLRYGDRRKIKVGLTHKVLQRAHIGDANLGSQRACAGAALA